MLIKLKPKKKKMSRAARRRQWRERFIFYRRARINDTGPYTLIICTKMLTRWSETHKRWLFRVPGVDYSNKVRSEDFRLTDSALAEAA